MEDSERQWLETAVDHQCMTDGGCKQFGIVSLVEYKANAMVAVLDHSEA